MPGVLLREEQTAQSAHSPFKDSTGRELVPDVWEQMPDSASGGSYQGPNGSTLQTAQGGAYKKAVGAFRARQFNATGANGGQGSGYMNNVYNAQTGTGTRNSGVSYTSPQGQSYGYDGQTNYTKGQGGTTTIDTQNKGDYTVDWQKGEKPVVTQTSAQ